MRGTTGTGAGAVGTVGGGERAQHLERGVDDVDRLPRPHQPPRAVLQDQPVPVNRRHPNALLAVGEVRVHRCRDPDRVGQPDLGVGGNGGAHDPQLAPLEIDPQRLAEGGQTAEYLVVALLERHDRVEPQAADQLMARNLVEEGGVRRSGDDHPNAHVSTLPATVPIPIPFPSTARRPRPVPVPLP